jgi:hypothetical protein
MSEDTKHLSPEEQQEIHLLRRKCALRLFAEKAVEYNYYTEKSAEKVRDAQTELTYAAEAVTKAGRAAAEFVDGQFNFVDGLPVLLTSGSSRIPEFREVAHLDLERKL